MDTNVLLDAAMLERPCHDAALLLLDEAAYGQLDAYVSAVSLKDLYYVLSKYAGERHARRYVQSLLKLFTPAPVDGACLVAAAYSDEPDFEDGIVRACAEAVRADFIISRDEGAFRLGAIRRISAQDYLDMFCTVATVDF